MASEDKYLCRFKDEKEVIVYEGACIGVPKADYESLWTWMTEADFELRAACIALGYKGKACRME